MLPKVFFVAVILTSGLVVSASEITQDAPTGLAALIRQLASETFEEREAATKKLVAADLEALPVIKAAQKNEKDAEVQTRLAAVLRTILLAHPEKLLKISLEGPGHPVLLGVGDQTVGLDAWFENVADFPIVICIPVDGSFWRERDPKYRYVLLNEQGKGYACATPNGCGYVNALRKEDFITLNPGEKAKVCSGASHLLYHSRFQGLKPGIHTVTLTYSMTAEYKPVREEAAGIKELQAATVKGTFVSTPARILFAERPSTEQLLEAVQKRAFKEVSEIDALRALGESKDARAVEPVLTALQCKERNIQTAAIRASQFLKDPRIMEALINLLDDPDAGFQAYSSLMPLTGQDLRYDSMWGNRQKAVKRWKDWWEKNKESFPLLK